MADLNKCYLTNNAFYQRDIRQDGFGVGGLPSGAEMHVPV